MRKYRRKLTCSSLIFRLAGDINKAWGRKFNNKRVMNSGIWLKQIWADLKHVLVEKPLLSFSCQNYASFNFVTIISWHPQSFEMESIVVPFSKLEKMILFFVVVCFEMLRGHHPTSEQIMFYKPCSFNLTFVFTLLMNALYGSYNEQHLTLWWN